MKNRSTTKSMVIKGAFRFVCLLMGISLFLSCSDKDENSTDGGNVSNQYLMLEQNGLNEAVVSGNEEAYTFNLTVKRVGSNLDSEPMAKLDAWNEEDLAKYNKNGGSSYTLLPTSLYTVTSSSLTLSSGANKTNVEIKFNPSKVFAEQKETNAHYVIALRLTSDEIKVKNRQRDVLLTLSVDYPKVSFTSTNINEVSVNEEITSVSMITNLTSQLNGEAINSWWNFTCKLNVPVDANELVTEYNRLHNTNYDLLPSNSYNLGEGFTYKAGSNQALSRFTVVQSKLDVKYYVLPLQLVSEGNDNVLYDNAIHYMVVARTFRNPIIDHSAPDPTVIRAKDGYFYLYSTETTKNVPIYRSKDLVNWVYMGTAFTAKTRPNWEIMSGRAIWAPEVRYFNGKYVLYYSWAIWGNQDECHIGAATSDSPIGPFIDHGCVINGKEIGVRNSIDQFYFEENGKKYMFWGSFNGIYATELTEDGLGVKKNDDTPTLLKKVCNSRFEGVNIYKKDGYYYLFVSLGGCCEGLNSSYRVGVGRSKDLLGPYVDDKGRDMLDGNFKLVVDKNSIWVGPGHNSILIQDDEGTEWMIYHGYKVATVDEGRIVLLDRLQWSDDGWPYINYLAPSVSDLVPVFK